VATFFIRRHPGDTIASAPPVSWAIDRLRTTLESRGVGVSVADPTADSVDETLLVAGADATDAARRLGAAAITALTDPESFAIVPDQQQRSGSGLLCGADVRGLVYAVLELADRVGYADEARAAVPTEPIVQRPENRVRSVTRLFCSEVEDKPWFHDETFWDRYLSMLVAQRFNRFSLTLGLGYNYPRRVTDAYLYFAYPFLVSVPGYDVRVPQLPDDERDRNLHMLRFISEQTTARGIDFQLGLWTHAFEWIDSAEALHTIEGLTPDRHATYCRDAVRMVLDECPAIGGLTFRIHGESGVPERSWAFWKTLFDGVVSSGRRVGIDLHAKGLDERTLRDALDTGMPVTVSPKFWAEHMGLPYHQAAIRELERPVRDDPSHRSEWHRSMTVSEGSRPFTRYGYADFLREDREFDVVFRLWAGTQRVLLWGDPAMAAGYGRAASFAGAQGLEWCEPLTFKGREGTGREGSRTGYADPSLVPNDDWQKFAYAYRLFGRLTFDPESPPEQWRRSLRGTFGAAASDAEAALASASRILPLVTTAHHPSASNNYFWPEMYTDMPIVLFEEGGEERTKPHPYVDTPRPRRAGTVSALDPEVFSSASEFVDEVFIGRPSGRVSPLRVARWLSELADQASSRIDAVERTADREGAEVRRWIADVGVLAALGHFFSSKLAATVWYELHAATGSTEALGTAIDAYRRARDAWRDASARAAVYVDDLTYGPQSWLRGHWRDRLDAIDADLKDMQRRLSGKAEARSGKTAVADVVAAGDAAAQGIGIQHTPPSAFRRGEDLEISAAVVGTRGSAVRGVSLRFRPLNQALAFRASEMTRSGDTFTVRLPSAELDGAFPLAYAFVVRETNGVAWRYPGVGDELTDQPYFVVRPDRRHARPRTRGSGS
jgi:hypothetical protein